VLLVRGLRRPARASGLLFGLAIACCIAAYTLVDDEGIRFANAVTYLELTLVVPAIGYAAGIAAVSFMLSIDSEVSELIFRTMLVNALLNALIALPVFALVRRFLRPALAVDPLEPRRRRAPATTRPIGLRGLET
jgi:hypothetical protein